MTVAVLIGYRYGITLWDWIQLLIVPAAIAGGRIWFNEQQREREQRIANERAQDEALQAYLDQMSDLLTTPSKDLPTLYERPGGTSGSVARARTLTVLPRLDGDRKARVLQFLYEAGLIIRPRTLLKLNMADLSRASLSNAQLMSADLSWAHLSEANLSEANLGGADLSGADLSGADLSYARLFMTDLRSADLGGADLTGAFKEGAHVPTKLVTAAELKRQTELLQGATMPDGQKYEDWLENRGRGEDRDNE
jgi:Pentapeptide repeats (8 copies)